MTLKFKHFDTRLNQWIHTDGDINNPDSILTEELDNTLLETYFPDGEFSFGHIDEKTQAVDLYNHPEGHVLLLSSKSRLLYGPPECLETTEKLCPDRKDRGAYGSIFLGSCSNAISKALNVLVIDNETGANGGVLPDEIAWRLVGDCHGKIKPQLAEELSGSVEHVIQYRLGIPDRYRLAKGTFAPKELSQFPFSDPNIEVDLIIPTSSFKGGDKENNPIQPGLHQVTIWLGEKERSQRGKIATSQAHASFPEGIKDFLKDLEEQAKDLQKIQNDPRLLAKHYCHKYEQRQTFKPERAEEEITEDSELNESNDQLMYRLIKADLEGDGQLLETQKVVNELKRFLAKEWRDMAIGKTIAFDRGMIIPSKDLKQGEIYVPWLPEGEEILNFRSPLLNSNGMCVSVNKLVNDALAPNGEPLKGVIAVNDEDHQRIKARLEALKAQGIETDEIDPSETESERQGRDYDGDCLGVALAKTFPNFTAEAKRRNLPENAYAPVKKEAKASFYREDGSQPTFEEIAIFMSDSISVGVINNHATALEALESEIDILQKHGTPQQKADYVRQVGSHYQKLIAQENDPKNLQPIKDQYRSRLLQVANIAQSPQNSESIARAMEINRSIYHEMVGEAGYQNQLAVDIFKSNRAPDMSVIEQNNRLLHRIPNYIRDKKKTGIYVHQPLEVQGFSPVELMVQQANTYFTETALVARPTEQFRGLFPEIYTPAQYNQALLAKAEFDKRFNQASAAKEKQKYEAGPVLKIQTQSGTTLEITNLLKFDHPQAFTADTLNLKLVENPHKNAHHKLIALAQVEGEKDERGNPVYKRLATVCEISRKTLELTAEMTTNHAQVRLAAPLTEKQIKLLFNQAYDCAREFSDSIAAEDKQAIAAATWHVCTTPENQPNSNGKPQYKISNFAFAAFSEEILEQTKQLQFTEFLVSGLSQHNQVSDTLWRNNQTVYLEIRAEAEERFWSVENPDGGEFLKFGLASPKGAQLPIGTKVQGTISGDTISTATLHLNHPQVRQPITFGKMGDFDLAGHQFNGERVKVTLETYQPEPKPILKFGEKEIGELDAGSLEMLKASERLKEGTALAVTLNTFGQHSGTYTLATTEAGNTLRVNRQALVGGFKEHRFNGETATVEIGFKQAKPAMAVKLEIDGQQRIAGIFTPNHKASKQALSEAGLFRDGATFEASITSNITLARIAIAPQSVQYPAPGEWQAQESKAIELDPTAQQLLDTLKRQPSLLHRLNQDWQLPNGQTQNLPTLRLAVDAQVAQETQGWLKQMDIPHSLMNPNDPSLEPETKRGYVVLAIVEEDIPLQAREQLFQHCGSPLDANLADLSTLSPYHQKLETIPIVKAERLAEIERQYPQFDREIPLELPQRQLPTLLSQETYEWQLPNGSFTAPIETFRISVDPSKLQATEGWLSQNDILFERATDPKDIETESQLGYAVLRFKQADIPSSLQQALTEKLGTPLDADTLSGSYYQRLEAIRSGDRALGERAFGIPNPPGKDLVLPPPLSVSEQQRQSLNAPPLLPTAKTNPLADLQPLNQAVAPHMEKDLAMAEVATQFIGKSSAPPDTPSSTRNYEQAWGDRANTGSYSQDDIIMISGSGPWRGVTQEQIQRTFEQHYKPLLDKAIASGAQLVVGNAKGTDQLVQEYLKASGYQLFKSGKGYLQGIPVLHRETPASVQPIREPWEKQMLTLALNSLKANQSNATEEIQTATFASDKFRAIYHRPTDTLYVVDEYSHRGTIYQAKRGETAQMNEFTSEERQCFLLLSQAKSSAQKHFYEERNTNKSMVLE